MLYFFTEWCLSKKCFTLLFKLHEHSSSVTSVFNCLRGRGTCNPSSLTHCKTRGTLLIVKISCTMELKQEIDSISYLIHYNTYWWVSVQYGEILHEQASNFISRWWIKIPSWEYTVIFILYDKCNKLFSVHWLFFE